MMIESLVVVVGSHTVGCTIAVGLHKVQIVLGLNALGIRPHFRGEEAVDGEGEVSRPVVLDVVMDLWHVMEE